MQQLIVEMLNTFVSHSDSSGRLGSERAWKAAVLRSLTRGGAGCVCALRAQAPLQRGARDSCGARAACAAPSRRIRQAATRVGRLTLSRSPPPHPRSPAPAVARARRRPTAADGGGGGARDTSDDGSDDSHDDGGGGKLGKGKGWGEDGMLVWS